MEQNCEILWKRAENGKNMTLIMCIEEPLIGEFKNTTFLNEINGNLSKLSKNSSSENKTTDMHFKNNTYNMSLNNTFEDLKNITNTTFINATPFVIPSVAPSVAPSVVSSITPSVAPSVVSSITPSVAPSVVSSITPSVAPSVTSSITPSVAPSVAPSVVSSAALFVSPSVIPSVAPSLFHEKEQIETNNVNVINPSPSDVTKSYNKNDSLVEINSDNTSLLILSISGSLILIFVVIYLIYKCRKNQSVSPCQPIVVSDNKGKYIRKSNNNNKPKDYILEILPGTPRSALFNRVPVAKKTSSTRRSRSLPIKSGRQEKLKKRVNSLPDLKKLDIEKNKRKQDLPPLPLDDYPPPVPIRNERIMRLVEIKKKMHNKKINNNKLMAI